MILILSAEGLGTKKVDVKEFAEASVKFGIWRDTNNLGASDLLEDCGNIYDDKHELWVAHISYNGKVWTAGPWNNRNLIMTAQEAKENYLIANLI